MTSSVYQPTGLGQTIFNERYAIHPGEGWAEAARRVSDHVAQAEHNGDRQRVAEEFYEELVTNRFMPGGRIWYGAGRSRSQLLNCFVLNSPPDSREGWGKSISDVIVVSGMGGGVGINASSIRPRGSKINGTGGVATGAVSLMEMINGVGDVLVSGGGRRMALMLALNLTHPDMPEFLDKKLDRHQLNNANVSVILDKHMPTAELVRKVKAREDFDLWFHDQRAGSANAYDIWQKIVQNAWKSGEPGVLNGDFANRESNIFYHSPLISSNPCGEIWLSAYESCDLGAVVLPRFILNDGQVDWEALATTVRRGVRFLDNVLSVNDYPLPEIRETSHQLRRLGLGVMGLHSALIMAGIKYSSPAARQWVAEIMSFIKIQAYLASTELAEEKGPFPAYESAFLSSPFVKRLPEMVRAAIGAYGIRNCALLTIAPTGTTGMVANVSTGIEPLFSAAYWRRFYRPTADGNRQLDKELVVDPLWSVANPALLEGAYDITPEQHFAMQRVCQRQIDNAVSKTINLPADYSVDTLSDLWLEYLPHLKGSTFYRAGSRGEEPLEAIPLDEARLLVAKRNQIEIVSSIDEQSIMSCVGGACDVRAPSGISSGGFTFAAA